MPSISHCGSDVLTEKDLAIRCLASSSRSPPDEKYSTPTDVGETEQETMSFHTALAPCSWGHGPFHQPEQDSLLSASSQAPCSGSSVPLTLWGRRPTARTSLWPHMGLKAPWLHACPVTSCNKERTKQKRKAAPVFQLQKRLSVKLLGPCQLQPGQSRRLPHVTRSVVRVALRAEGPWLLAGTAPGAADPSKLPGCYLSKRPPNF